MSSQLYNKIEENIKIINDEDESYLVRSLLREELENIRALLNKEHDINQRIWRLQKGKFIDGEG